MGRFIYAAASFLIAIGMKSHSMTNHPITTDYLLNNSNTWLTEALNNHSSMASTISSTSSLVGTWRLVNDAGAFGAGPNRNDVSWFSNTVSDVTLRSCQFDDLFVFDADGTFQNVLGNETWVENWQDAGGDRCDTPVAPFDGSANATYVYDATAGTLTISGTGAYMGLNKVNNAGELNTQANWAAVASITYLATLSDDGNELDLDINYNVGGAGWWQFKFEKVTATSSTTTSTTSTSTTATQTTAALPFDDFEGGGNITWDSATTGASDAGFGVNFSTVSNTFPGGINSSSNIGRYEDTGAQYANMSFNYGQKFDLTTDHVVRLKVYVPTPTTAYTQPAQLAIKLQDASMGGNAWQTQVQLEQPYVYDQWQELVFDFSAQASATNFDKIVVQFNSENNFETVVAYFDDFKLTDDDSAPAALPFDDFEGGGNITWDSATTGAMTAGMGINFSTVTNTFAGGINTSANVGRYQDTGAEAYANMSFDQDSNFDLTYNHVVRLKVYVPTPTTAHTAPAQLAVKLQDGSSTQPWVGQAEIVKQYSYDQWQELVFDFNANASASNFNRILLQFNGEGNNEGVIAFIDDFKLTDDDSAPVTAPVSPIVGTWRLVNDAGAFGAGPNRNDVSWFSNTVSDVTLRSCQFDDLFVFDADGTFQNVLGNETWVENWQDAGGDRCDTPVAPFDGSANATYVYDATAGTLTISGTGAYMGLNKVNNAGELNTQANWAAVASITYLATLSDDGNELDLDINYNVGGAGWWQFKFEKVTATSSTTTSTTSTSTTATQTTAALPFDDFEGGGNITWDSATTGASDAGFGVNFSTVSNTFPGGINSSSNIGRYEDTGAQYANMSFNYGQKFDLTTDHVVRLKVYVPTPTTAYTQPAQLAIKLQDASMGGNAWQTQVQLEQPYVYDQWQELVFDFSAQASATNFDKIVVQFNSENNFETVVAYFDDFKLTDDDSAPAALPFDDFEGGGNITWDSATTGAMTAGMGINFSTVTNTFAGGINTSANVGRYQDTGAEAYANMSFDQDSNFDLTYNHVVRLKVYVPTPTTAHTAPAQLAVKLQDGSSTQPWVGQAEIVKQYSYDQWQELVFDFNANASASNFNRILLQFNGEGNNEGVIAFIDDFKLTDDDSAPVTAPVSPIVGTWRLVNDAGAFGAGPNRNDVSWFSNTVSDVTLRSCQFDDLFVFDADGTFQNVLGNETWVENWQDAGGDRCDTPVAPFDGSANATYVYDATAGTLTISGTGAYMGLNKVNNAGELNTQANWAAVASITYLATLSDDGNELDLDINYNVGGAGWWQFKFEKVTATSSTTTSTTSAVATCTQTGTQASQGSFTTGYISTFETDGADLNITFELLDQDKQTGLVAFLHKQTPFAETQMTQVSPGVFSTTVSGVSDGDQVSYAAKFAYAGGLSITEYIAYTVGTSCSATTTSTTSTSTTTTPTPTTSTGTPTCTDTATGTTQGDSVDTGYTYTFETVGTDLHISFELLDTNKQTGLVAYLWKETPFAETPMTQMAPGKFSIIVNGVTNGDQVSYAAKFAYAGGFTVTDYISYEVGTYCNVSPIVGTWRLVPAAGTFGFGEFKDVTAWWSNSAEDVVARSCEFDDHFVFNADGTFQNVQGDETWLEPWETGENDPRCGTPVAPFDGSAQATYLYDENAGTLTLNGTGAYMGLKKVINGAEISSATSAADSITYFAELSTDGSLLDLDIQVSNGWWQFKFERYVESTTQTPTTNTPSSTTSTNVTLQLSHDSPSATIDSCDEASIKAAVDGNLSGMVELIIDANPTGTVHRVAPGVASQGTTPNMSAPMPIHTPADAISIFSEAYTDVAGTNFAPVWGQPSPVAVDFAELSSGNNALKYENLSYQGTEFGAAQDVSNKTHIHVDYWTPDATELRFFLIGGGENGYSLPITTGKWNSIDIDLTEFPNVNLSQVIQFKVDTGSGANGVTVYFDNLYFHSGNITLPMTEISSGANSPQISAPTPNHTAGEVVSIYSDYYTDLTNTEFNPNWGQQTIQSEVQVAPGDSVLKYLNLNYQGTEFERQDLSNKSHLHVDYWTTEATQLTFTIVSHTPGAEKAYTLPITAGQWNSIDIALTEYSDVVNLADVWQFKAVGNGTVYFDNFYFHNGDSNTPAGSTIHSVDEKSAWETRFIPNDYGFVGALSLTVSNAGALINGVTGGPESLQLNVTASNCATVTVELGTTHPDTIVSSYDNSVEILAYFSAPVNAPTLTYTGIVSSSSYTMNAVSGNSSSTEWTYNFPLAAVGSTTHDILQFTVETTGLNGESISNASTERLLLTYDNFGPIIEYIDVDDEDSVVDVFFTEDLFSDYIASTATGTVSINDFSLTLSSTTANLSSAVPLSMEVEDSFITDGKKYRLGFEISGDLSAGDALIVNIVADTYDIAGNPVDLSQSYNMDVYEVDEEETIGSVSLSHNADGDTLIACEEVTITATFSAPATGPIVLNVVDDSAFSNARLTLEMEGIAQGAQQLSAPDEPAPMPNPAHRPSQVISIYSNAFANIANTNFNPNWGQQTVQSEVEITAGENALKYSGLNYQGTEFTSQNVSNKSHIHIDYWTADSTELSFYIISKGPPAAETLYELPIRKGQWNSIDIALSQYSSVVDLSDVWQFKVVGNGTVYFDNLYFHNGDGVIGRNQTQHSYPALPYTNWTASFVPQDESLVGPLSLSVSKDGTALQGANGDVETLVVDIDLGDCDPPLEALTSIVASISNDSQVTNVDTCAPITVTAVFNTPLTDPVMLTVFADVTTGTQTPATVSMTAVSEPERAFIFNPVVSAPVPTRPADEVLSIFSESYPNVTGTEFYPNWGQATGIDFPQITSGGNQSMLYSNLNYQGTQFGSPLNLTDHTHLHIDYWTSSDADINFYLISEGPAEKAHTLEIVTGVWNSMDIALSEFADVVNLAEVIQFKVDTSTPDVSIYWDNIYFHSMEGGTTHYTNPQYIEWEATFIPNKFDLTGTINFGLSFDGNEVELIGEAEAVELDRCRTDTDGDGIFDDLDICPGTEPGRPVNEEGCSEFQVDVDEDGVPDYIDNCVDTPNTDQLDNDGDGIGNVCDPDPSIVYISLEVSENASPTTQVVFFEAFNSLQESITLTLSDTSELFELSGRNAIVLVGELDFETNEFHVVELTATTPSGGTTTENITIMVSDIPNTTYTGKFFVSIFDNDNETQASKVDHTRYFNPFNKSVGKWNVRKRITGGADAALFTIRGGGDSSSKNDDESEGTLEFLTAPDFENPQDHNGDNIYEVEITYENLEDGAREVPVPVTQRNIQMPENTTTAIELQSTASLPEDDTDNDGVPDIVDNSPLTFNPTQIDEDGDGIGDVSDDFDHDGVWNPYDNCPDTPLGEVVDENGCIIFYTSPNNFSVAKTEKCAGEHKIVLEVRNYTTFDYQLQLTGPETSITRAVNNRLERFSGLAAGTYNVCVTANSVPVSEFQRCFTVTLNDPEGLSVMSQFNSGDEVVNFQLKGGTNYTIVHNGKTIQTDQSNYALSLAKGVNKVRITNGIECQGVYERTFMNSYDVTVAPNPVQDQMQLFVGGSDTQALVEIFTSDGKQVFGQLFTLSPVNRTISVPTQSFTEGTYYVKVQANTVKQSKLMIKE